MEPETTQTLKLGSTFFLFTKKGIFLVPEREYKQIRQRENGYVCLKRKYLSEIPNRDTERVTCIVCHGEAAPEDLVFPLCRKMHYVVCKECMGGIHEGTDERKAFCPYCNEEQGSKVCREEILDAVLSLMSPQTLPRLELRPDMEVETVTRLTHETRVALSNVCVSDAFFFKLLARTVVEITNIMSLFPHDNSLDCCAGEFGARTGKQTKVFIGGGYTREEMKQVYSNIKTMPSKNIRINAKEIHANEDGVYFLLKAWAIAGGCSPDLFLKTTNREHIEEFLEEENTSIWIGKVKTLRLAGYALGILPKLKLHEENVFEELILCAHNDRNIAEILKKRNNSILVGKVKRLELTGYEIEILSKLRFHEENVMEKLMLCTASPVVIPGILKAKNNSIWVGKVKKLITQHYGAEIIPKLRIHEENVMEELDLYADANGNIADILKEENNSVWVGRIKKMTLTKCAIRVLPKFRMHEENVLEELELEADSNGDVAEVLGMENNSVLVGRIKKLTLIKYAVRVLPKLRMHEENVMEELFLFADSLGNTSEILKAKNNSILVGKVKRLDLRWYAIRILPKLRFHEENVTEELGVLTGTPGETYEILKPENKSILDWIGKMKKLELGWYALEILPNLRIHEENVMELLELSTDKAEHVAEILKTENRSILIGRVKKLGLVGYAVEILPKLRLNKKNAMDELCLGAYFPEQITEILKEKDKSIQIGKVRSVKLDEHAQYIKDKLDFKLIPKK
ncbi:MAG: uncharacterized protein A8A55_2684 [Amphiamblys sp. WSBS2006]|nr:MAG: uncharacterized protein A8A55_2684 [Amphiamblys sp. WSBS2006]